MTRKPKIQWLARPQKHDYPAAQTYLSLIRSPKAAAEFSGRLRKAPMAHFMAKDILRASGLPLLGGTDYHVNQDRKKVLAGLPLSPLLLVRDKKNAKVLIADGYHRLCAVYELDANAIVPCKII